METEGKLLNNLFINLGRLEKTQVKGNIYNIFSHMFN